MNNLLSNIGHIVIAIAVITVSAVLGIHGTITGGECIGLIAGAAGFTMGGSVASASAGAGMPVSASTPSLAGTSTLVESQNGATTLVPTIVASAPDPTRSL